MTSSKAYFPDDGLEMQELFDVMIAEDLGVTEGRDGIFRARTRNARQMTAGPVSMPEHLRMRMRLTSLSLGIASEVARVF